jgi:hypothetical protein
MFNVREISGVVGNIQLDIADMRERFDTIERKMATREDIVEIKASQSEQSDLLRLILAELRGFRGE